MSGPKREAPGEGGGCRHVHFTYAGCAANQKWFAHIAGDYWSGRCHESRRTKPCLTWITDGDLPCPRCSTMGRPTWCGYQPLWRESDGAATVVIVHECAAEFLQGVHYPERVMVTREAGDTASVVVCRALDQRKLSSSLPFKRCPQDVFHSLLTMWALPELWDYARAKGWTSDNAVSPMAKVSARDIPTEPEQREFPLNRLLDEATKRAEKDKATADRAADQVQKLREHAARNGKPKG